MTNKYNFDEIINRRGTDSVKWDLTTDAEVLPMWVADMDFKTSPEITEAILKKVSQAFPATALLLLIFSMQSLIGGKICTRLILKKNGFCQVRE